jgi:ribonucleotide reductase alpha subunit
LEDKMLETAKTASTTLKEAQKIGKELGSVVSDQQADMEATVQKEHKARVAAKLAENARKASLEVRALEKFESKFKHEQELAKLKADTIRKYGKDAWVKVEVEKSIMEKERQAELTAMDIDRHKQIDLFCWCLTAAAFITYFLKLYKI